MSDAHHEPHNPKSSPENSSAQLSQNKDELNSLRSLLLGPELEKKLKYDKISAEDIAAVLPDAIIQSRQNQAKIVAAVVPTVEDAIKSSVKTDSTVLSETLFPVIGPATRKAVSAAIKNLSDSLNQGLEQSLSPQSFKWRFEAWRTGKSFAEVMLLRTLLFQVEQVLLIHKETGLVLQDIEASTVAVRDPDLVSAMLTAIQDFIQDSFSVNSGSSLDSLEYGDLTLWVEGGPKAVLACVIRGVAPQNLRTLMQNNLEKLHLSFDRELALFEGDQALFDGAQSYLEECLQSQYKTEQKKKKIPWLLIILLLSVLGVLAYTAWGTYLKYEWRTAVNNFDQQPGIVVLKHKRANGKYVVEGMRDPQAMQPQAFFKAEGFEPQSLQMDWEPYWSMHPEFLKARASKLLDPPSSVQLSIDENLILKASGIASNNWITQANQLSNRIDGISGWDDSQLNLAENQEFQKQRENLESQRLLFAESSNQLVPKQEPNFQKIVKEIKEINRLSQILNQTLQIKISGQTDPIGTVEDNTRLSQARADTIKRLLIDQGIPKQILKAQGITPSQKNAEKKVNESDRRVSFRVSLSKDNKLK